ncbi:YqjF family protein [Halobacillus sp. A5]|uniref:YqjF family protein n=1 Tax=Halobacillus sp. A5 TaxID=2880263 RepID=UPI0020A67112|nr:DUF2071 domain-containing protein [Halobacillus sp. A5]MCP3027816.1 DUF2071 domain-containing protein [Halobacillus sp. A5]
MDEHILQQIDHRSAPLPKGPWVMTQKWEHLLFIHLPVAKEVVELYIPNSLSVDTYEGDAWVTVLPFEISDMHWRHLPPFPKLNTYLELNVRTYVKHNGRSGLYFFSLDASNMLAVIGARATTLPYYYARMNMEKIGDHLKFYSKRQGRTGSLFQGEYHPSSEKYLPHETSLEHWLLERYYAWSAFGRFLVEVGIHHTKWEIQKAQADVEAYHLTPFTFKEMAASSPLMHYVCEKRALFWPINLI